MSLSIDVRLAIQAMGRQGHKATLDRIAHRCEEHRTAIEEEVLILLRRGELAVVPTDAYVKAKGVPSTWKRADMDVRTRINKLFGEPDADD